MITGPASIGGNALGFNPRDLGFNSRIAPIFSPRGVFLLVCFFSVTPDESECANDVIVVKITGMYAMALMNDLMDIGIVIHQKMNAI